MEPINLNSKEEKRVRGKIIKSFDELLATKRRHGWIFSASDWSYANCIIEAFDRNNAEKILKNYTRKDIVSIITELVNIQKKIWEERKFDFKNAKLSDFLAQEELNDLANKIVVNITKPRKNEIFINLPNIDIPDLIRFQIGDTYALFEAGDWFMKAYDRENFPPPLHTENFKWKKNTVYLLIRQPGFFSLLYYTLPFKLMISKLKVFLGMALIQGIFEQTPLIDKHIPVAPYKPPKPIIVAITSQEDNHFHFHSTYRLPENISELVTSLKLSDYALKPLDDLEARRHKAKPQCVYLAEKFDKFLYPVLDSQDEDAERIKASCEWYFESLCADNPRFCFIQSHIAIESLLGDPKKRERIKERMSDRCAFLLGRNQKERKEIKEEFENSYKIRCRLVHTDNLSLSDDELSTLSDTQTMLRELVRKEIQNYSSAQLR